MPIDKDNQVKNNPIKEVTKEKEQPKKDQPPVGPTSNVVPINASTPAGLSKSEGDSSKPAQLGGTAGDHAAHQTPLAGGIREEDLNKTPVGSDEVVETSSPNPSSFSSSDFFKPEPSESEDKEEKLDKVCFQFDRDTTVVAQVVNRWEDGTVDLIANTDPTGHYKTNISQGSSDKLYSNVRPGNRFEPGTYFELLDQDLQVGEKVSINNAPVKRLKREVDKGDPLGVQG